MSFRAKSRLIYLKNARHHRGHGIHSPFLFYLITNIIENKKMLPEYEWFKTLKNNAISLLNELPEPLVTQICRQFNLPYPKRNKLYKKVELPLRFGKVVAHLIRYYQPSAVINYGSTLGTNLALMAKVNVNGWVYQIVEDISCELICKKLIEDSAISNIFFIAEKSIPEVFPKFIMINNFGNSDQTRTVVQKHLKIHGDDDVLVIRGIHNSKEMKSIWIEITETDSVHVTLDMFEIGIALFRKGLQKENFILRF